MTIPWEAWIMLAVALGGAYAIRLNDRVFLYFTYLFCGIMAFLAYART